jgi:hypothetical protein
MTASRSPCRPMPNSRLNVNKTGSSDSEYELRGEDVQDQRRRKSSRRDRPSPVIVATCPPAAAPTSYEGKSRRKTSRTRRKKSRLTRSCRNPTIAEHRHRCHASLHTEPNTPSLNPTSGPSGRCTSPRMVPPRGKRRRSAAII